MRRAVSFTANGVNQRSYTNPATVDLGRVLLGTVISTNATITTAGLHATTTDSTLLGYGGGAINGLTLTGGPTFIDGSNASDNIVRAISGTLSGPAGTQSGTFNLNATDELAGAVTNAASVSFTANGVNQRSYTNPATVDLGRVLLGTFIGTNATITTAGLHATTTDSTLLVYGGGAINGLTLTGGPTFIDGSNASDNIVRAISGTLNGPAGHAERHVQPERDG